MSSISTFIKFILILASFLFANNSFSQRNKFAKISNSVFPNKWDIKRNLRGRNGKVLAWSHIKNDGINEYKECLVVDYGVDSAGQMQYFISDMYSDEKPYTEWNYNSIHYSPNYSDTASKLLIGYWDTHMKSFNHRPTKKELYDLIEEWEFSLLEKDSQTLEAGIDERLWLNTFGFVVDKKKFVKIE